jgi:hypothetical protein
MSFTWIATFPEVLAGFCLFKGDGHCKQNIIVCHLLLGFDNVNKVTKFLSLEKGRLVKLFLS